MLRALDGVEVTVDGTRGRVFRGLLPLHQVGGEMDVAKLPLTKTKVGLILADVGQALFLSRLRMTPGSSRPTRSQSWQVTSLCFWSRPSQ